MYCAMLPIRHKRFPSNDNGAIFMVLESEMNEMLCISCYFEADCYVQHQLHSSKGPADSV